MTLSCHVRSCNHSKLGHGRRPPSTHMTAIWDEIGTNPTLIPMSARPIPLTACTSISNSIILNKQTCRHNPNCIKFLYIFYRNSLPNLSPRSPQMSRLPGNFEEYSWWVVLHSLQIGELSFDLSEGMTVCKLH